MRAKNVRGFSLLELLVGISIVGILCVISAGAGWRVYQSSSLAVSANNIRQLSAGGLNYLAENNNIYWSYYKKQPNNDVIWWFGLETRASQSSPEGTRNFDPAQGPLAGYIPKGIRPDPSFTLAGRALKPKYRSGYIGVGYNVLLGGGWTDVLPHQNHMQLADPARIIVFTTSAQVNVFQSPASMSNPMLEEFYGIDQGNRTVHFRHRGYAMVAFASGSAGFLPIDETTRDRRAPNANIGRFAPVGSTKYLLPE